MANKDCTLETDALHPWLRSGRRVWVDGEFQVLKTAIHRMGRWYVERMNRSAQESHRPKRLNERTVEYGFVFNSLVPLAPRTVLDVGTGKSALPALLRTCGYHVTAIDNISDYWSNGMFNQHFQVLDDDIVRTKLTQEFDVVLCISVLEHIVEYRQALHSMAALTRPGGHVIVTCPFNERIGSPNAYLELGSYGKNNPYPCRQYTRLDFEQWMRQDGLTIVKQEFWRYFDSEYWSCGTQIMPPERTTADEPHQHTCLLLRKDEKASGA